MKPFGYAAVWCEDCQKLTQLVVCDFGIGPYEYWGARGNDVQNCPCCAECEGMNLYTNIGSAQHPEKGDKLNEWELWDYLRRNADIND